MPKRAAASQIPAGVPYTPHDAAPMLNTCTASPNETSTGTSGARAREVGAAPGRRDEEVEQHRLAPRRGHEHVAAGAEPGQQRLGDERREHRRQRGVDRVAARAEDIGPRGGGQRVAGRDDAGAGHPRPLSTVGMNSGTSTSPARTRAGARVPGLAARRTRGSPTGSRNGERSSRGARFSP